LPIMYGATDMNATFVFLDPPHPPAGSNGHGSLLDHEDGYCQTIILFCATL